MILIFTDLDGTLLDHISYKWDKAKPALEICRRRHVPIIMVSSKTRAEMDVLRREMKLPFPFVSENGGGIFFPKEWSGRIPSGTLPEEGMWKYTLGTPYSHLVRYLQEIRDELRLNLRGFSEMSPEEISGLTGLDRNSSLLAAMREFDEPFVVIEEEKTDLEALRIAAKKRGLQISKGGRFYHIHGKNDKGEAIKTIISWFKQSHEKVFTVALGDSPNDFPMFEQVDQPVLVYSQQDFHGIEMEIPGLVVTREPGPEGWNVAVQSILGKKISGGIP